MRNGKRMCMCFAVCPLKPLSFHAQTHTRREGGREGESRAHACIALSLTLSSRTSSLSLPFPLQSGWVDKAIPPTSLFLFLVRVCVLYILGFSLLHPPLTKDTHGVLRHGGWTPWRFPYLLQRKEEEGIKEVEPARTTLFRFLPSVHRTVIRRERRRFYQ